MQLWYAFIAGIIFYVLFKTPSILKFYKKKKEDLFLKSVDYSKRIPDVRSKPLKGKRRTKEQIKDDSDAYQVNLGNEFRKMAKIDRIKAEKIGSKGYIWRGDDCCDECLKNNGKKFNWTKPPSTGHPGEGFKCKNGYCRCWAEVIVPAPKR